MRLSLFKIVFAVGLILVLVSGSFAGDKWVTQPAVVNQYSSTGITIAFPANSDSTGSQHSYPIYIGNSNTNDAWLHGITNAATDYNTIFHFSNDLTNWQSVTASTLDAQSNTLKTDTLGGVVLAAFHRWNWVIVESDGHAGTNSTDTHTISFGTDSEVTAAGPTGQPLKHVFYTTGGAKTNP